MLLLSFIINCRYNENNHFFGSVTMKIIIILLTLFIPFILFAQNKDISKDDGEDWLSTFSNSYKLGYIAGYLSAVSQQYDLIDLHSSYLHNDNKLSTTDSLDVFFIIDDLNKICKRRLIYSISIGTIMDLFDKFYADPLNRKILISDAWRYAAAAFNGVPENSLNEFIQLLRWRRTVFQTGIKADAIFKEQKKLFPLGSKVDSDY